MYIWYPSLSLWFIGADIVLHHKLICTSLVNYLIKLNIITVTIHTYIIMSSAWILHYNLYINDIHCRLLDGIELIQLSSTCWVCVNENYHIMKLVGAHFEFDIKNRSWCR